MRNNDWTLFCKIAGEEPYKEHTVLQTPETITDNPAYYSYIYGETIPTNVNGRVLCTSRNDKSELIITKMRANVHQMIYGASGSCKTQGAVLGELSNMDGRTSYIVFDTKAEVTPLVYSSAAKKYGADNVMVANFMQPAHSMVRLNPFVPLANMWLSAEKADANSKKAIRDHITTEIRKFIDCAFEVKSQKDPTWEETAKDFIFSMVLGLFEDLTLTAIQEKKFKRPKTKPHQINFETVAKIFNSFSWERRFDDHGFLSKRDPSSGAFKFSKSIRDNAQTTRANYMGFVQKYLIQVSDPKIVEMSKTNTFDIISMANTPKVLFVIYDQSDVAVRDWVNVVVSYSMQSLLAHSHQTSCPLKVPVVAVIDEFPTLRPNTIYPTILETGRGSNLFLTLVVQSLSQLKSRYPEDHVSMVNNCALQTFLGTNDFETARAFSVKLGQTTVPDPQAFLQGHYASQTVNVVTSDKLMHRMTYGETFLCVDRQMPIHGSFCLHYRTKEYHTDKPTDINTFQPLKTKERLVEYDASLFYKDDDDDDDDLFDF